MLEATELRIGNLVNVVNSVFDESEVVSIYPKTIRVSKNGSDYSPRLTNVKPIPLTEEWLERFDATEESSDYWEVATGLTDMGNIHIYVMKYDKGFWLIIENGGRVNLGDVEFVHDLQNKIFALTGEELPIIR